jgi:23S rRNA pseudouridine1911/1915/1917 synthase
MAHIVEIVVPPGKKKERLDIFITGHVENATRNKVQQAIRAGDVRVNGIQVRPSYMVMPEDIIQVTLPRLPPQEALPENIPLDILFEDDDLVVVNKPAGMVTHPAYGNYTGTLVNALLYHCGTLGSGADPVRPGIVHRLDKGTSGVMVAAKNERAHAKLAEQFSARTIRREYQAIVWGRLRDSSGVIEAELGRSRSDRKKMAVVEGGKAAATEYTVLEQFEYLALLRLKLHTGRTHQIRVHLAHIHHPVFGDPTYNGRRIVWESGRSSQKAQVQRLLAMIPRQALHAKTIGFAHPVTRKELFFDTDLPWDMKTVLDSLGSLDS